MHVTAIATISLDGRITPPDQEGTPFSSTETGANLFAALRANEVTVSGRRTFDVVRDLMRQVLQTEQDPPLGIVLTRDPAAHTEDAIDGRLEFTALAPDALVADLEARGYGTLLVAGGGEIYAAFAASDLVDEWVVAVEPVLLGGGTPLFSQVAEQQLRLREHRTLNDDTLLLRYEVDRAVDTPAPPALGSREDDAAR
jgi:dihydrofolate reductase